MNSKVLLFVGFLLFGLTVANLASADLVNCGGPGETACTVTDLIFLIERIINFLLAWAWLFSLFFILWASYNMIAAGGNSEALDSAKSTLSHALIGFFLIMAGYLLINFIVGLLTGDSNPRAGAFDSIMDLIR
jgi:hypothetical protein